MSEKARYPAPQVNPETKPFWDAAATGKFLIKRCAACGEPHYFPRTLCPFCFSDKTVWEESSGEGEIYTFSLMRKSATGPYAIGYVTLKDGPSLLTNFVDCDMHIIEPADLFTKWIDPRFRDRVITPVGGDGQPKRGPWIVDGISSTGDLDMQQYRKPMKPPQKTVKAQMALLAHQ